VIGHEQGRIGVLTALHGLEKMHARGVATRRDEPRHERVFETVLGAHVGDVDRLAMQRAGQLAGGRARGNPDAELRLAEPWRSGEDRRLAERDRRLA
jgi:hypothetical protein